MQGVIQLSNQLPVIILSAYFKVKSMLHDIWRLDDVTNYPFQFTFLVRYKKDIQRILSRKKCLLLN